MKTLLLVCLLSACASGITTAKVVDVGEIVSCVFANRTLKFEAIAVRCGVENADKVAEILSAHDKAAREDLGACKK